MLGLWKSKKRKAEEEKNDLKAIVTEDLLGASEWKESKVGYLSGLSSVGRIASNFAGSISESFGRTGLVFKIMTREDSLPSLPEVDEDQYDGRLRFRAAMHLHRVKEKDMARAISNTWRSFYFYGSLTLAAVAWLIVDMGLKDKMALTTLVLHIAPIPILGAYTFKAAFTNWTFRKQTLVNPNIFLKSLDWLPKK
ncbi:hypothetical protein OIU34_24870 [Pararhizobium sp. BT-229]|uniref:hypothetical protein n=1 Tax=Pararhizobium sp. BT-229 TaxID=2986923 RepID=UPI0021F7C8EB|nr:hypothetical protein [Pararhizobium sp. BT-229]MCV9965119.1 hypothetical protein [Pararhizobium sp. BT-229]